MKTNIVFPNKIGLNSTVKNYNILRGSPLTKTTEVVRYDSYEFGVTIINPSPYNYRMPPKVFLFLAPKVTDFDCMRRVEQIATELAIASGQVAVFVNNTSAAPDVSQVFQLFAALKWICQKDSGCVLNCSKVAIVGAHFGAHLAMVLSLMAHQDSLTNMTHQILINPRFYSCSSHQPPASQRCQRGIFTSGKSDRDWLNLQNLYDSPLDARIDDFSGLPPTFVQLSENNAYNHELEYYCTKLFEAGAQVSYANYEANHDNHEEYPKPYFSKSLLRDTAAELRTYH